MWSRIERNVTGSQSSYVAVGGDVVNYSCQMLFHESGSSSLNWAGPPLHAFWRLRKRPRIGDVAVVRNLSTTLHAVIPDGPATVSYTCYVDRVRWKHVFWQSTAINVSCEYETLSASVKYGYFCHHRLTGFFGHREVCSFVTLP